MKKPVFALIMILICSFSWITMTAYADIPNVIITGPESKQGTANNTSTTDDGWAGNKASSPSEKDLVAIGSGIEYPRETEYLDEYSYGVVQAPGGHSVYCYGSADMNGSKYTVADGEEVEILARRGQMLCIIIPSQNKARWIREANVMIAEHGVSQEDGLNNEGNETWVNLVQPDESVENNNDFNSGLSAAKPESGGNESEKYSDDVNRFFSSKAAEAFDYYSNGDRETAKSKFRYYAIFENDPVSKTVLALRYPNSYTDEQRFELIHEAAADGYAPAIYSLALFYEQGVGVEEDKDKANELFRTAADILYGVEYVIDPEVAYTIGQCYEYGDGNFEKDDGKAASLYAHSAMHGESAGATAVGKMIFQERIKSDTEDMVFWFTQAKDAGDPEGTFWYAVMVMLEYAEGDVDELMKTAADGGSIQAKLYIESGTLYIFM